MWKPLSDAFFLIDILERNTSFVNNVVCCESGWCSSFSCSPLWLTGCKVLLVETMSLWPRLCVFKGELGPVAWSSLNSHRSDRCSQRSLSDLQVSANGPRAKTDTCSTKHYLRDGCCYYNTFFFSSLYWTTVTQVFQVFKLEIMTVNSVSMIFLGLIYILMTGSLSKWGFHLCGQGQDSFLWHDASLSGQDSRTPEPPLAATAPSSVFLLPPSLPLSPPLPSTSPCWNKRTGWV